MAAGELLFTDANKITIIDDCIVQVQCKYVQSKDDRYLLPGGDANASIEEENGETVAGLDVVLNQGLNETAIFNGDKKMYENYLRDYCRLLVKKWKELGWTEAEVDRSKDMARKAHHVFLKKFDDLKFDDLGFFHHGHSPFESTVAALDCSEDNPVLLFFKVGLLKEEA